MTFSGLENAFSNSTTFHDHVNRVNGIVVTRFVWQNLMHLSILSWRGKDERGGSVWNLTANLTDIWPFYQTFFAEFLVELLSYSLSLLYRLYIFRCIICISIYRIYEDDRKLLVYAVWKYILLTKTESLHQCLPYKIPSPSKVAFLQYKLLCSPIYFQVKLGKHILGDARFHKTMLYFPSFQTLPTVQSCSKLSSRRWLEIIWWPKLLLMNKTIFKAKLVYVST